MPRQLHVMLKYSIWRLLMLFNLRMLCNKLLINQYNKPLFNCNALITNKARVYNGNSYADYICNLTANMTISICYASNCLVCESFSSYSCNTCEINFKRVAVKMFWRLHLPINGSLSSLFRIE